MKPDFYAALNISRRPIITNPPAPAIGGVVFVMAHGNFFSVNHQSASGDTGWQSERIDRRVMADLAAAALADHLQAEVVK
jgi:hypothetical protein